MRSQEREVKREKSRVRSQEREVKGEKSRERSQETLKKEKSSKRVGFGRFIGTDRRRGAKNTLRNLGMHTRMNLGGLRKVMYEYIKEVGKNTTGRRGHEKLRRFKGALRPLLGMCRLPLFT